MKPMKCKKLALAIAIALWSVSLTAESNSVGQTDALTAAAANKQIEGDDAANGTSVPTSRLGNYCQIASKYAIVTDTQQAVDKAGRASEMSYQVAKRLGELKRKQCCAVVA